MKFGLKFGFQEGVSGAIILPPVPVVIKSRIGETGSDGILVVWDREMMTAGDITSQISVIINGGTAVHPDSIEFHPHELKKMGIIMPTGFDYGDVVTWAYDDTGVNKLQELALPNAEADNQTYSVNNNLPDNVTAFVSGEVAVSSGGNHINVTLSDEHGYASDHLEWFWKKNGGAEQAATGADFHGTPNFQIGVGPNGTIAAGDTITVSHKPAVSGIAEFIDQPVTNNLV